MLKSMLFRRPRLRGRFRKSTCSWSIRRQSHPAIGSSDSKQCALHSAQQLALFVQDMGSYQLPAKFSRRRRNKRNSRAERLRRRGKQYKLTMRLRQSARVIEFRHRAAVEEDGNTYPWTDHDQRLLHYRLLLESLEAIKDHIHAGSVRVAEIWRWIMRKGSAEPFAFETCVAMAGCFDEEYIGADPDTLRMALQRLLRRVYGVELPHADVLRAGINDAESGDPDAIAWVLSDATTPLSFCECCDALGFDPYQARMQLQLPATALRAIA